MIYIYIDLFLIIYIFPSLCHWDDSWKDPRSFAQLETFPQYPTVVFCLDKFIIVYLLCAPLCYPILLHVEMTRVPHGFSWCMLAWVVWYRFKDPSMPQPCKSVQNRGFPSFAWGSADDPEAQPSFEELRLHMASWQFVQGEIAIWISMVI